MTAGLILLAGGAVLLLASLRGQSITDFLKGSIGTQQKTSTGYSEIFDVAAFRDRAVVNVQASNTQSTSDVAAFTGQITGHTPKEIIDNDVLPVARQDLGVNISPQSVAAANARHGPTASGSQSDHQGPPDRAWAADMSNGQHPTKEMDALARDLAHKFGIHWSGSGAASIIRGGFRYQLLYRTFIGGNHFNHVHFGVRKVGR